MTKEQFILALTKEQESLRRFLLAMCKGDSFTADDIAQEASLKAYLAMGRFERRANFSTWLFRIAYNCLFDHFKKTVPAEEPPENIVGEEQTDDKFKYEKLYFALEKLSKTEQVVTLLFYMEDKSIKEIEKITSMPSGKVRSHLSRARKHLKELLGNERY